MTRLSLRLRIFLFFAALALAATALAAGALAFGWSRAEPTLPTHPFLTAFIAFAFLNTGLVLAIWLLFDENIAKPITRLSVDLRLRAHSGIDTPLAADAARYLGDLAPAVSALASRSGGQPAQSETARLEAQRERLTALLSEMPVATILINPAQEIVLYDAQAAAILKRIGPPRLKAPLAEYFDTSVLAAATPDRPFDLPFADGQTRFEARLRPLGRDGHMILIEPQDDGLSPDDPRPLVFDFDLIDAPVPTDLNDTPLRDLCFVAFDTETTGLSVKTDAIVQIGAVRLLNGRIIQGETLDTYVDPGRPIPSASTRIHGITDADVEGAPDIAIASRRLHDFARDAVLVAHNAPFDIGLLRETAQQSGLDWSHPVLDTVLLSAVVFGTTEKHDLDALCARLSITIPPGLRHTAFGDAKATGLVLEKLLPLLDAKGIATFGDLIAETRKHGRLLEDLNP